MVMLVLAFSATAKSEDNATSTFANKNAAVAGEPHTATGTVPRRVKFSGVMTDAAGKPATGAEIHS